MRNLLVAFYPPAQRPAHNGAAVQPFAKRDCVHTPLVIRALVAQLKTQAHPFQNGIACHVIKLCFLPDASVSLWFRKYREGLYLRAEINKELVLAFWVWAGHLSVTLSCAWRPPACFSSSLHLFTCIFVCIFFDCQVVINGNLLLLAKGSKSRMAIIILYIQSTTFLDECKAIHLLHIHWILCCAVRMVRWALNLQIKY